MSFYSKYENERKAKIGIKLRSFRYQTNFCVHLTCCVTSQTIIRVPSFSWFEKLILFRVVSVLVVYQNYYYYYYYYQQQQQQQQQLLLLLLLVLQHNSITSKNTNIGKVQKCVTHIKNSTLSPFTLAAVVLTAFTAQFTASLSTA